MNFSRGTCGMVLLAALITSGWSQAIVGVPYKGAKAIKETTEQIMKRQASWPDRPVRIREEQEVFRFKTQNPNSPATSSFPAQEPGLFQPAGAFPFTIDKNFLTVTASTAGAYPPDTMGAVGPNDVVVAVNGRYRSYTKAGAAGALNADPDVFFNSVRTAGSFTSDPRIRFDRLSNRWISVIIDVPSSFTNNRVLIAVSDGPNITGSTVWSFYQFQYNTIGATPNSDTNGFFDYPTLGIDEDALYIGGNSFIGNTWRTSLFVVRKSSILSGGPIVVTPFRDLRNPTSTGMDTPQGVDNDQTGTSAGYVIGTNSAAFGVLTMRKITNPDTTPVLGSAQNITVPTTGNPISVSALGSSLALDGLDDRLYHAAIKRNTDTGLESLWTSHSFQVTNGGVAGAGARNGSRFYEITNFDTTPTLRQSGTLFSNAASSAPSFWIPSAMQNGQGHMILGASTAGSALRPSCAVAGRLVGDTLGTISDSTPIFTATASYGAPTNPNRWGDYSFTCIDPLDNMTFWGFQMCSVGTNNWGIRVFSVLAPPPAPVSSISPGTLNQGYTGTFTINGSPANGTGYYEPGAGFSNHLSLNLGAGITVNSITSVSPTQIVANITVSGAAAPGVRSFTIVNPDGQSVTGQLTVNAANPVLNSINPSNRNTLSPGFTLNVSGSNFQSGATVLWNGSARATTFVNSTTLTAAILGSDLTSAGNVSVTVQNPGGSTSGALLFNVSSTTITGNIQLGEFIPDEAGQVVGVIIASGSTTVATTTATLGASGALTLTADIPAGNYDVYVKGAHWLQKKVSGVIFPVSGAAVGVTGALTNGDVDGDNEIGPNDFSILSGAFGTSLGDPGFVSGADLDGDDEVGPSDFSILATHFGDAGDTP